MAKAAVSVAFDQDSILAERERVKGVVATKTTELRAAKSLLSELNKLSALYSQLDVEDEPEWLCSQRGCGRSFTTQQGLSRHKGSHRRAS